jgi:hypothetical protein
MNRADLEVVLSSCCGLSYSARASLLTIARDYCKWCVDNNIEEGATTENVDAITVKNIDPTQVIRMQRVKDWQELETKINDAFGIIDEKDYSAYQVYLLSWLAFVGIPVEDATYLKHSDIDLRNKIIRMTSTDVEIDIPDNIVELIKTINESEVMAVTNSIGKTRLWDVERGEFVICYVKSDHKVSSTREAKIHNILSRCYAYFNDRYLEKTGNAIKLSYNKIFESGKYNKLYKIEQAGKTITKDEIAQMFNTNTYNSAMRKLTDYKQWKNAFKL